MKIMDSIHSFVLGRSWLVLVPLFLWTSCSEAQDGSYKIAQSAVDAKYKDQVFWIKASGTPDKLNDWTYYFYDPSTASKARLVHVVDGRIDRVQPASFATAPSEALVFDPAQGKVSSDAALAKAKAYAASKQIKYDSVKMQLRRPATGSAPTWRVSLYQSGRSAGTVYLNDTNGEVAHYDAKTSGGGVEGTLNGFAGDVERTFKGVGGDLEQFFTGERTVDR